MSGNLSACTIIVGGISIYVAKKSFKFLFLQKLTDLMEQLIPYFTFPVNILCAFIWALVCYFSWKNSRTSAIVRFFLSPSATISSISIFLISCMWIGLSGDRTFVHSIFFVAVLLHLQTVLLFVLFRGWKDINGKVRLRFVLNHAGLLLALGAAFWGNPDNEQLRMKLETDQISREAYRMDGSSTWLKDEIQLVDLDCQTYENGAPMQYSADIKVGETLVELKVNHPYSSGLGDNIYLTSVGDGHCVLEIVHEPWKYFALAGIIMMIAGAFLLFFKGPLS